MAGLGKGLKALAGSVTPPKKDINPLLKQMEEAFTTPDPAPFGEGSEFETEVVGRFYSPVYSAIKKMPIGKEGTKGENIMGYLNKRAPNVDKSELESFNINLEPNKKYTREEVLALAREKGSPDYTIEKFKVSEYVDTQRQNISDKELDYVELILQGKQNYTRHSGKTHFGGKKNIGHSRVSIRQEMPEGGPLSQKIVDRPRYLLIEELQSDLSKVRDDLPNESPINIYYDQGSPFDPDIDIEQFNRQVFYPKISGNFDDLVDELNMDFNIYVDRNVVNTIKSFYLSTFDPELIDDINAFKKIREDDTYKNLLIKQLKDEHNIDAAGRDIETVALDAIRKKSDTSSGETNWSSDGEYEYSPDEVLENEIKQALQNTKNFIDNAYLSGAPKEQLNLEDIQTLPVATRSEYVKRLLLANIAYAKQNGINKIVIPNYKEIARQRTDDFDAILYTKEESDPLVQKYLKSVKEGKQAEVAQEYYEGVFKPIYEDAVKKVLNGLKAETKGAIKTKTKQLKYPDLTEPDRFRKSNALEIDITEFEYDPETSIFRFAEGGAVPMEEQMKLFEEGGLRDEGGMVDEVSGNDVPIGSTRKEVRDDIPAMLSEGEFVFPADVVRFLGLERLMNLRQEAKMGLKQMEAMGQMGNSDEATMPDDLPFGMADLVIVEGEMEPQEKAHGGVIHANQGTFVTPIFDPQSQDVRPYTNDGGQTVRYIPFLNGQPVYPIPEGYVPLDQATAPEAEETPEAIPTGGDDGGSTPPFQSEFQKAGGWNMDTSATDGKALDMWIKEAEKVSTFGNVAAGIGAAINPLMGGMIALANKQQKKQILDMLDEKIAQARKTPIQGQVAALQEVKDRLTTKEGQSILGKVISEITGTVTDALGLTEEEKKTAKIGGKINAGQSPNEPDEVTKKGLDIGLKAQKLLNLTPEQIDKIDFEAAIKKAGQDLGVSASADDLAKAVAQNYEATAPDMAFGPQTRGGPAKVEAPVAPETPEAIPTAPETPSIAGDPERKPEPVKLPRLNKPLDTATPDITVEDTTPAAFGALEEADMLPIRTSLQVGKVKTALDELRESTAPYRGGDSGMTLKEKIEDPMGTVKKSWQNLTEAITEVSTSDYTPPTQPTPTTVKMPSDDDDGPSFADMANKMKAEQAAATADFKTAEVAAKAKAGGASQAEVEKIKSEGAKVKEKLEQQSKGIKTGFKKGGLASRKK
jgi:hypothetical protein